MVEGGGLGQDDATLEFETSKDVRVFTSFDVMDLKVTRWRGAHPRRCPHAAGPARTRPRGSLLSLLSSAAAQEDLLRGIYTYGFNKPSAIQQRAIVPIIKGRDVIAQAQSGTGKSSLIALTMCQVADTASREVQALCLSPTRELAVQTEKVVLALGDFMSIQAHACIGGKSIGGDIQKLESGVQIVSGTPGRVFDMIQRRNLRTRSIKMLVLDEADEMLSKVGAPGPQALGRGARRGAWRVQEPSRPPPVRARRRGSRSKSTTCTGTSLPRRKWCWCRRRSLTRSWR